MLQRARLYLGVSVFWLALSLLFDGLNSLVLPAYLQQHIAENRQATVLGLLSFIGLLAGLLIQPAAGALSDRLRGRLGRKGFLALGVLATLAGLAVFGLSPGLAGLAGGYLLVQISASLAQAAQQGLIPDLVPVKDRGKASGWKTFMDLSGAMLGFVLLGELLGAQQERQAVTLMGLVIVITFFLTIWLVREPRQADLSAGNLPAMQLKHIFQFNYHQHRSFAWLVISRFMFLLGTYAVGRFLLYFVAARLSLPPDQAAEQAGGLLAGLALVTVLGAPAAGWAADRWGRLPVILFGSLVSAAGVTLLIFARDIQQIFIFGALMSVGSSAFASANWALTADLVPAEESARFFGLANIGTAGAAAAAGMFGPLIDWVNAAQPAAGYPALFLGSALAFILSALALSGVTPTAPIDTVQILEKEGNRDEI